MKEILVVCCVIVCGNLAAWGFQTVRNEWIAATLQVNTRNNDPEYLAAIAENEKRAKEIQVNTAK